MAARQGSTEMAILIIGRIESIPTNPYRQELMVWTTPAGVRRIVYDDGSTEGFDFPPGTWIRNSFPNMVSMAMAQGFSHVQKSAPLPPEAAHLEQPPTE
jgi:hypothetical protein